MESMLQLEAADAPPLSLINWRGQSPFASSAGKSCDDGEQFHRFDRFC
ncbi:MAG TPA: hypothetical protein VH088_21050 [Terriglobales bacterium]|nr:hypothetical protein [Terriglobales bacterium]